MEKRLPSDKLKKIKNQLDNFLKRKKVTLQELQSLIGLLSFACSVVTHGRLFLRRLIDLTIGLKQPHYKRKLTCEAKADLTAWSVFIRDFNGKSLFLPDRWETSESLSLYTDSSGVDFGGYLGNHWFAEAWPIEWRDCHITFKELFLIVVALEFWAVSMRDM